MLLSHARRDAHGRWLSALLALALAGAQGASLAHLAIVKHAYCPEHGELIHPDARPHASASAPRPTTPGLYASEEEAHAHGHDHCILSGQRRDVALAARTTAVPIDGARQSDVAPGLACVPASNPRFRLAPKQSPPA